MIPIDSALRCLIEWCDEVARRFDHAETIREFESALPVFYMTCGMDSMLCRLLQCFTYSALSPLGEEADKAYANMSDAHEKAIKRLKI